MTPAKRRRLLRTVAILLIMMVAGISGRMLFFNENLRAQLMGLPPGSEPAGTILIHRADPYGIGPRLEPSDIPAEAKNAIKLKFNVLGGWKFIEGKTPIPEEVKEYNGKWVEISGFMWSNSQTGAWTQFIMVQSLWDCCFGKAPDMNHFIEVKVPQGQVVKPYFQPVRITGKLSVGESRDENGKIERLYQLQSPMVIVDQRRFFH